MVDQHGKHACARLGPGSDQPGCWVRAGSMGTLFGSSCATLTQGTRGVKLETRASHAPYALRGPNRLPRGTHDPDTGFSDGHNSSGSSSCAACRW